MLRVSWRRKVGEDIGKLVLYLLTQVLVPLSFQMSVPLPLPPPRNSGVQGVLCRKETPNSLPSEYLGA